MRALVNPLLYRGLPRLWSFWNKVPKRCESSSSSSSSSSSNDAPPLALIFDTETTGKADFTKPPTDPSQPDLVQLGMILVDTVDWKKRMQVSLLIKGASPEPEAQEVHGISKENCEAYGMELHTAVDLFQTACRRADVLVAHNLQFDQLVMEIVLHRSGLMTTIDVPTQVCTMKACTDILKLPGKFNNFKWPSLAESYAHFTNQEIVDAHDALNDADACLTIFRHLVESGALDPIPKRVKTPEDTPSNNNVAMDKRKKKPAAASKSNIMALMEEREEIPAAATIKFSHGLVAQPGEMDVMAHPAINFSHDPVVAPPDEIRVVAKPGELVLDMHSEGFCVTGNTYPYKDSLKSLGAKWNASLKVWAFDTHDQLDRVKILAGIVPQDEEKEENIPEGEGKPDQENTWEEITDIEHRAELS